MNAPSDSDKSAVDATKAPLLDHLVELRKRLIWSVVAFVVCFAICFAFAKEILAFLTVPLAAALQGQSNRHLISTALTETFFTYVRVGMFGGLCLGFPIMAAQLWMFVAPGLYKNERKAFLPFLLATPVMFIAGASFVYYVMMPFAIRFLLSYQSEGSATTLPIELEARISEYLDFVMTLIFAFGLTFQMPVLLGLLGKVGIISARQLRDFRRYAIVAMFAVAAFITPPDAISMLSLAVPLVALYEGSILIVALIEKKRLAQDAEKAAASE